MFFYVHKPDWAWFIAWSSVECLLLHDLGLVSAFSELDSLSVKFDFTRDFLNLHKDWVCLHEPRVERLLDLKRLGWWFLHFVHEVVLQDFSQLFIFWSTNEVGVCYLSSYVFELHDRTWVSSFCQQFVGCKSIILFGDFICEFHLLSDKADFRNAFLLAFSWSAIQQLVVVILSITSDVAEWSESLHVVSHECVLSFLSVVHIQEVWIEWQIHAADVRTDLCVFEINELHLAAEDGCSSLSYIFLLDAHVFVEFIFVQRALVLSELVLGNDRIVFLLLLQSLLS